MKKTTMYWAPLIVALIFFIAKIIRGDLLVRHETDDNINSSTKLSHKSKHILKTKNERLKNNKKHHLSEYIKMIDKAKMLSHPEREQALRSILLESSLMFPEFSAQELGRSGLPHSCHNEIAKFIVMHWEDSEKALEWANKTITGQKRGEIIGLALAKLVVVNPDSALTFHQRINTGNIKDESFRIMMAGWANSDVVSAWRYMENISNDDVLTYDVISILSQSLATQHPAIAKEFLESQKNEKALSILAQVVAHNRVKQENPTAVIDWADSLPPSLAKEVKKSAIKTWSQTDMKAAVKYIEHSDIYEIKELMPQIASEWSKQDPAAAAKWIEDHQASQYKGMAIREVVTNWLEYSPLEASIWLGNLPEGKDRDEGVLVLIQREISYDPSAVFSWAQALSTEILREEQTKKIIRYIDSDLLDINR
ncbi:MAG: hypothetical protein QM680_04815 [Luteolibacter sp.]